jgi:leucine dehydrogenase
VADICSERVQHAVDQFGATAVSSDEILATRCDILAPCALGAVFDETTIATLNTGIVCGACNNVLCDPDVDALRLQDRDILYAPDFVVNAGGLIHLAGLHLGYTPEQLTRKISHIEETTLEIFTMASDHPTIGHAALAMARQRVKNGAAKEQINAN